MRAVAGDELLVRGRHVGDEDREGVIVEVRGGGWRGALSGPVEGRSRECVHAILRHPGRAPSRRAAGKLSGGRDEYGRSSAPGARR